MKGVVKQAAEQAWSHLQYLEAPINEEALQRQQRARERRIRLARFLPSLLKEKFIG